MTYMKFETRIEEFHEECEALARIKAKEENNEEITEEDYEYGDPDYDNEDDDNCPFCGHDPCECEE